MTREWQGSWQDDAKRAAIPDPLPDRFVKKCRAVFPDACIVPTCTPAWKLAASTFLVEGDYRATGVMEDWVKVAAAFLDEARQLRKLVEHQTPPPRSSTPVHDAFGLTYANYHVVPRVLLEAMPVAWQERFVTLMEEFDKEFPGYAEVAYKDIERVHPRYAHWSPAAIEEERERRATPECGNCGEESPDGDYTGSCPKCGCGYHVEDPDWQVPTIPDPLANYRRPDRDEIERMRREEIP